MGSTKRRYVKVKEQLLNIDPCATPENSAPLFFCSFGTGFVQSWLFWLLNNVVEVSVMLFYVIQEGLGSCFARTMHDLIKTLSYWTPGSAEVFKELSFVCLSVRPSLFNTILWLISFFSGFFCTKLEFNKQIKVIEPIFVRKFLLCPKCGKWVFFFVCLKSRFLICSRNMLIIFFWYCMKKWDIKKRIKMRSWIFKVYLSRKTISGLQPLLKNEWIFIFEEKRMFALKKYRFLCFRWIHNLQNLWHHETQCYRLDITFSVLSLES